MGPQAEAHKGCASWRQRLAAVRAGRSRGGTSRGGSSRGGSCANSCCMWTVSKQPDPPPPPTPPHPHFGGTLQITSCCPSPRGATP